MVRQSLEQSLQQKLSPQQIQLMKLIELSTLELEQKVKDEIAKVREDFGFPPLVTPASQIIGAQSLLNVTENSDLQ